MNLLQIPGPEPFLLRFVLVSGQPDKFFISFLECCGWLLLIQEELIGLHEFIQDNPRAPPVKQNMMMAQDHLIVGFSELIQADAKSPLC
ncbi:hypothetical protein D3C73_1255500 [compost metagenome]